MDQQTKAAPFPTDAEVERVLESSNRIRRRLAPTVVAELDRAIAECDCAGDEVACNRCTLLAATVVTDVAAAIIAAALRTFGPRLEERDAFRERLMVAVREAIDARLDGAGGGHE